MKAFKTLFNWYFRKSALPYWCVIVFDVAVCIAGGSLMLILRHQVPELLEHTGQLCNAFLVITFFNLIGFRIFHTYSGILRYSQFIDLLKVGYAMGTSLVLALLFHAFIANAAPASFRDLFYPLTGRMVVLMYASSATLLALSRVLIKVLFDNALISKSAENALIYGNRAGAIALANELNNEKPVRFIVCGFIGDEQKHYSERLMGKHVYSIHENLAGLFKKRNITALLVSPLKNEEFNANPKFQDFILRQGVKIFVAQNAQEWTEKMDMTQHIQMRAVKIEDLLPRNEIQVDLEKIGNLLHGSKVLITGSAGSIGSEMVRQIASFGPADMMLIDQAETPQHDIRLMMLKQYPEVKAETIVTSICRKDRMEEIFRTFRPDAVFHAAAYKHVPMMEDNPSESIENNVLGTKILADLSVKYRVKKFVMISTDKAVNPTNVMGCSKRICEIYVQSLNEAIKEGKVEGITQFVTTRFGNVLGSNGSVIPLFRKQLEAGGPLTVTHPDIIRFFMLIPEACRLVLEAGTHGSGGEIFVFDMGEPVRIADLARRMIALSGLKNIEIKYTGLREGEKLYEEVLSENEGTLPSFHKKIRIAQVRPNDFATVSQEIDDLCAIAHNYDDMATVKKMKEIVPEYISKHSRYEVLDKKSDEEAAKA